MNDETDVYLAAGKIIVFSTGEYSDYGYSGMYVTLRPLLRAELREVEEETIAEHKRLDAEEDAEREAWHEAPPETRGKYPPMAPGIHELFQSNLVKRGLLMVIDYDEMHLGSYRELRASI